MNLSVCGIDCNICKFKVDGKCKGCHIAASEGKCVWNGRCELYDCATGKSLPHCGLCPGFLCAKLKEWASSENPERIDNLKNLVLKEKRMKQDNFLKDSKKLNYTAEVDGSKMDTPYRLYLPDGYENMGQLPIILFLHENGETWTDETSDTAILQKLIDDGRFPCIILAPVTDRSWCDWQPATVALKLTKEIINTYNCNPDKFYVVGFGMGAFAVYDFIGHKADNNGIAAAVSVGGAYMFELIKNIKNVPLWIFYSDNDFEVENYSKKMVVELDKAGGKNHKSTEYTNAANKIDFICGETNLFVWLFEQHRLK